MILSRLLWWDPTRFRIEPIALVALAVAFVTHVIGASAGARRDWGRAAVGYRAVAYATIAALIFVFSEDSVRFIYFQF